MSLKTSASYSKDDGLGMKVLYTSYHTIRAIESVTRKESLTVHTMLCLYFIYRIPQISAKELSVHLNVAQPTLSTSLKSLVTKKYLNISTSRAEKKQRYELTLKSKKLLKNCLSSLDQLSLLVRTQEDFRIEQYLDAFERTSKAITMLKNNPPKPHKKSLIKPEGILVKIRNNLQGEQS